MKYEQVTDGDWVKPVMHGYKLACCDCGLVHNVNFRIMADKKGRLFVQFQPSREPKLTKQLRARDKSKKN